ncbi:hypothetical protein RSOLAG1IB_12036 [Rhizoctonia solani AG-1 IB]|uniref:Retroviral polymerase SH3-like domain-containing protein n=1 Tax=Thanatephorus cucumeris (strain AG1-IB / isolate 7/3/14) TaxID=1108050 RepID=A0A0B7FL42_THACB|nr:hypothetical protein RSOLAG1IB_12036 [Rhizoctonia solani AG-1 IB]
MLHGHSNTLNSHFLWQEAFGYATLIQNNLPHKIQGEWRVLQIEMYGKAINMKCFQLFGTTCHVLIQRKGQSKIEAKTRKAIFTGIDQNSGGVWRYYAPPDRAICTSQNVFFPRHLPNPASSDTSNPSNKPTDSVAAENWVQVFAPSEGEMGNKADAKSEAHTSTSNNLSTRHKSKPNVPLSPINNSAQGESITSSESPTPDRTKAPASLERSHRPIAPAPTPATPAE